MLRMLSIGLALLALATPAIAADSLGIFDGWGAFRDTARGNLRCYAIARPATRTTTGYASIGYWPDARIRGQFYARLPGDAAQGRDLGVTIGTARFALVGNGANAWARDARTDAAIVAAIRSAASMTIAGTGASGRRFNVRYALKGAATAIDAAALGCARR